MSLTGVDPATRLGTVASSSNKLSTTATSARSTSMSTRGYMRARTLAVDEWMIGPQREVLTSTNEALTRTTNSEAVDVAPTNAAARYLIDWLSVICHTHTPWWHHRVSYATTLVCISEGNLSLFEGNTKWVRFLRGLQFSCNQTISTTISTADFIVLSLLFYSKLIVPNEKKQ